MNLRVLLLASLAASLAFGEERAPGPDELSGREWLLVSLGGAGVLERVQTTLHFAGDTHADGHGGCNRYFGTVEIRGDAIEFGPLGTTQIVCPEAVMEQERTFLKALAGAYRIVIEGESLLLYCDSLEQPLRFTEPRPPKRRRHKR